MLTKFPSESPNSESPSRGLEPGGVPGVESEHLLPQVLSNVALHNVCRSKVSAGLARLSAHASKGARTPTQRSSLQLWLLGGGCCISLTTAKCLTLPRAECKAPRTRLLEAKKERRAPFDWSAFFRFLKPDWLPLLVAVISALVVAALNINIPVCLGAVVNVLSKITGNVTPLSDSSEFFEEIQGPAFRLLTIFILQSIFTSIYISTLSYTGERFAARLRQAIFESVLKQDMNFFDKTRTGEIMNSLSGDVQEFKSAFKLCISQGLRSFAQTVGCGVSLYYISPSMTAWMVAVVPVMIAAWHRLRLFPSSTFPSSARTGVGNMTKQRSHTVLASDQRRIPPVVLKRAEVNFSEACVRRRVIGIGTRVFRSSIWSSVDPDGTTRLIFADGEGGRPTARSAYDEMAHWCHLSDSPEQLFHKEVDKAEHLHTVLGVGIGCFQGLTNLAINGLVLGVLYMGGNMMEENRLGPGQLMSFLVATQMIQRSLSQIFVLFGQYVRGCRPERGSSSMKGDASITGGKQLDLKSLRGDIEFHHVSFAYSSRPNETVIDDVTLKLPAGKIVAICGPSGSGKSTIAALLERFYDVSEGVITLDGHNIKDLDPSWLRRKVIGFIRQEPVLFATSIMENIRYGNPEATDEEVYEAARQANAHDFITSFPKQYDTVLGERGVTVSGGQKQRIAIARALVKNPHVLILDEATSALDTASEQVVQATLDKVSQGRTVLVIAHRLSTIRNADIIAVLLDGNIVEIGDHKSLSRLKGVYWKLTQHHDHASASAAA
ncbi:hypothetical protein HPB47_001932 [Ixodes persulcatus]|uniref:Uncharacterized protein n=1 Tax=Ixodes persulcatus TaxID=34615 RepID=A0AC60QZN8_IXOPE|nr:hypothetical protein HPB47_001932 [Ixodes persulcatus]